MKFLKHMLVAGACCTLLSVEANANLVVNGGFETGDFSGWTVINADAFTNVVNDPLTAHTGCCAAFLGNLVDVVLEQSFVTDPGKEYQLDLFLAGDGQLPNHFVASIDNTPIIGDLINIGQQGYTLFSATFIGTGSVKLGITSSDFNGFLRLDDVSVNPVSAVPEQGVGLLGIGLAGLGFVRYCTRAGAALRHARIKIPA